MLLQKRGVEKNLPKKPLSMRARIIFLLVIVATAAVIAVNFRPTSQRAAEYYQSALEYLEKDDAERAIIELENVFKLDPFHRDARTTYADLMIERGDMPNAYRQLLRVVEQYPNDLEIRHRLAKIAFESDLLAGVDLWDEVTRHGEAAIALDPNHPISRSLALNIAYREAYRVRDTKKLDEIVKQATALSAEHPEETMVRRIITDGFERAGDHKAALQQVDALLASDSTSLNLNFKRIELLDILGDQPGVGAHLRKMFEENPENIGTQTALLRWYVSQNDLDGAEKFLRDIAGADTAAESGHIEVMRFLRNMRGIDAAYAENERLILATDGNPETKRQNIIYRSMLASLRLEKGESVDTILADMEALIAENSDNYEPYMLDIRVSYAELIDRRGNRAKASAMVEEILSKDPSHVYTLHLRAKWKLQADEPGEAVIDLRKALNQDPRNIRIILALAEAHQREGATDLAGQRLALAYEVSQGDPDLAVTYAQFLMGNGDLDAAKNTLVSVRDNGKANITVMLALAQVLAAQNDWTAFEEVITTIEDNKEATSVEAARRLRAMNDIIRGDVDSGIEKMLAIIRDETISEADRMSMVQMLMSIYIRAERPDEARALMQELREKYPENDQIVLFSAMMKGFAGDDPAIIEEDLRSIVAKNPAIEQPSQVLYMYLEQNGRHEESMQFLEDSLVRMPKSETFKWIKAGRLEQDGDIDGAIAIYEAMYAENTANDVVANNLASLITTYKNDTENLEKAFKIARRLRGSTNPSFQDTYGWIEYRRGNFEDALPYLEFAAERLDQEILVQYHLGMALAALGDVDRAKAQLQKAIGLSKGKAPIAQMDLAAQVLKKLGLVEQDTAIVPDGLTLSNRVGIQNEK